MEQSQDNTSKPGFPRERRYIRIDNKICFLDNDYYSEVFCRSGNCWVTRILFLMLTLGITALIGLL